MDRLCEQVSYFSDGIMTASTVGEVACMSDSVTRPLCRVDITDVECHEAAIAVSLWRLLHNSRQRRWPQRQCFVYEASKAPRTRSSDILPAISGLMTSDAEAGYRSR